MEQLDSIFTKRFGGAVNIRGISYQIRYSILRAFELYDKKIESVTLEGIEDLDLKGFFYDDDTFIQVKTSENSWKWHQIKNPLVNFIEIYKVNPNAKFVLVLNNSYKGDIEKLSKYTTLDDKDKNEIEKKFIKLCQKEVQESEELLLNLLMNLTFICLTDEELMVRLGQKITEKLDIHTEASYIYLSILISHFLDWSKKRKRITKADIQNLILDAKEKLSVEQEFQAVGKGLISKINWDTDNYVNDYYEGKNTQPSHISSNADYKRLKWLEIINKAVVNNKLCLIKGSSGQGKSSLLYRYAYDYWLKDNIYKLNALNSLEHIELLLQFLRHRAQLGLPILVLIDNVNFKVQYWSDLVEACSGFEIHFLLTVRKEDWSRYGKENLEFEVIEPILDLYEAIEIFKLLKQYGKISLSINSPETAYERIGDNKLLIEYIYLITQGEMLQDRLLDQINKINNNHEDPIKIDILRKVSLSSVYNVPLITGKLISTLPFKSDPQAVLKSLEGEYLKVEDQLLQGMHWVRTEHLYRILFDAYTNPSVIALEILDAIPKEHIKNFVSGLLSEDHTDRKTFIEGLVKKRNELSLDIIVSIAEGFYSAGEKIFFKKNREIFDEANKILGHNGPWLLAGELLIATPPINTFDKMIDIFGPQKGSNYIKLKELYTKQVNVERGTDFCMIFLNSGICDINVQFLSNDYHSVAKLLDWVTFCKVKMPFIDKYLKITVDQLNKFQTITIDNFILIVQALFRFDENLLMNWYKEHTQEIISYLKLNSDSIFLEIQESRLRFKFIPKLGGQDSVHEQTNKRVTMLQDSLPFIKSIDSEGLYYLPENLKPSHDNSIRNMSEIRFYFKLDIERNRTFLNIVKENYDLYSYYEYQNLLYLLRKEILVFFKEFITILIKLVKKIKHTVVSNFENGALPERIQKTITKFPDLPPQTNNVLKKEIQDVINTWSISIKSFISQIESYTYDETQKNDLNLSLINLRNALEKLPELHKVTIDLCSISPYYFPFRDLPIEELQIYSEIYDLIELHFKINPSEVIKNPLEYIRSMRNSELTKKIEFINQQFVDSPDYYVLSDTIVQKEGLNYYSIMFEVVDVVSIDTRLSDLLVKLCPVKEIISFFCLIPVRNQRKIIDGHFFISSNTLEKLEKGESVGWEAFVPIHTKNDLIQGLPHYELETNNNPEWKILLTAFKINLQCLESYQNIVSTYLKVEDEFDKKLIENHKISMNEILKDTISNIEKIKIQLSDSTDELVPQILDDINSISIESSASNILDIDFSKWVNSISYV